MGLYNLNFSKELTISFVILDRASAVPSTSSAEADTSSEIAEALISQ
jgi:hypothetical protein